MGDVEVLLLTIMSAAMRLSINVIKYTQKKLNDDRDRANATMCQMYDTERDERMCETSAPRMRQLEIESFDASICGRWLEECKAICLGEQCGESDLCQRCVPH